MGVTSDSGATSDSFLHLRFLKVCKFVWAKNLYGSCKDFQEDARKFLCQNNEQVRKNEELKSVRSYLTLSEVVPVYGSAT